MIAKLLGLLVCSVIFLMGAVGVAFWVVGGLFTGAFDAFIEDGDDGHDSY